MSFQIIDADGKPVPIALLDQQAATFWGQEIDNKRYAVPKPRSKCDSEMNYLRQGNWYDTIGYCIHTQGNWCSGWANVVNTMIDQMSTHFIDTSEGYKDRPVRVEFFKYNTDGKTLSLPERVEVSIYATLEWLKPYLELINHWQSKGYQPKQIKE